MTGSAELGRARRATALLFFFTGAVAASWMSRIPAVQDDLGLSPGALGVAILGLEGGAIAGLPLGGALATRLGSRRALRAGFAVYPPALVAVGLAPALGSLAAALAVMAAATSVIDVAMNVQGVELERRHRRPVLAGLHAGHAFGVLGGGLCGTAAAAAGVGHVGHFALVACATLPCALWATLRLVDEPLRHGRPVLLRPSRSLLLLGGVAFCAFLLDGTAYNWTAVHLRSEQGASAGLAAAGFSAFALTLAVGRLVSDSVLAPLGRLRFVQAAALVAAAGAALTIAAPGPGAAIAGWALFGAGLAGVAPAVLGAAPDSANVPAGAAIAAVTTIGYLGSFTGPPLIGGLAQVSGLSAALGLLVVAALAAAALARPALRGAGPPGAAG